MFVEQTKSRGSHSFYHNRSAPLHEADDHNGMVVNGGQRPPPQGLAMWGTSHKGVWGQTLLPGPTHCPSTCLSTLAHAHPHPTFQLHQCPGQEPQSPSPQCWEERRRLSCSPYLCPLRENSFASFSIESTVPIVNQELREILKIKSETTGYVQEGDDYAGIFISRSCSILFVYFRVEMVL